MVSHYVEYNQRSYRSSSFLPLQSNQRHWPSLDLQIGQAYSHLRSLHVLFALPGMLFLKILAWQALGLSINVSFIARPSLNNPFSFQCDRTLCSDGHVLYMH